MEKSLFKRMGGTYHQEGDYFLPDLSTPEVSAIGGVLYALKWPGRDNPRFGCHEVFHVFIVLGSAAHFVMMYKVLLPL